MDKERQSLQYHQALSGGGINGEPEKRNTEKLHHQAKPCLAPACTRLHSARTACDAAVAAWCCTHSQPSPPVPEPHWQAVGALQLKQNEVHKQLELYPYPRIKFPHCCKGTARPYWEHSLSAFHKRGVIERKRATPRHGVLT